MINENLYWQSFLLPYELAVGGFIIKLEAMRKEFLFKKVNNPIEIVSGRVKSVSSILEKAERLNIDFNHIPEGIYDIAGIRVTCKYIEDVYTVADLLKSRKDIDIFLIKDYIKEPKASGYRSLHLIAKYNVETVDGRMPINIEFQIRTHAMHLWASIEHTLKYKYYRHIPEEIQERLIQASIICASLDDEMTRIKSTMGSVVVDKVRETEPDLDEMEVFLNSIKKW
ncbi:MAG TPA: GTP pyrophosphokinase family protein [Bacilli bacterium]|nr:MAG: GTP pyrophosphokinase YjbM [Tenericutes bacterium ADurb.BinA124]HNZ50274.1 GTP pyrophosphokinase family protein [Bacilli bacterium]HPN60813.1 GTP pyrophosphokinase family protein [Bacilli bacterium]HPX84350.1 GTP pyrophosphokinase family protein [Bacilli bacterium]HQC73959.1 GTP pyrophosphokinase family protein [Bacilli bacterium]